MIKSKSNQVYHTGQNDKNDIFGWSEFLSRFIRMRNFVLFFSILIAISTTGDKTYDIYYESSGYGEIATASTTTTTATTTTGTAISTKTIFNAGTTPKTIIAIPNKDKEIEKNNSKYKHW